MELKLWRTACPCYNRFPMIQHAELLHLHFASRTPQVSRMASSLSGSLVLLILAALYNACLCEMYTKSRPWLCPALYTSNNLLYIWPPSFLPLQSVVLSTDISDEHWDSNFNAAVIQTWHPIWTSKRLIIHRCKTLCGKSAQTLRYQKSTQITSCCVIWINTSILSTKCRDPRCQGSHLYNPPINGIYFAGDPYGIVKNR